MVAEVVRLDLQGEICPYTLTRAVQKVQELREKLEKGQIVLEVLVDHHPVIDNYPAEFSRRGFKVDIEKMGGGCWVAKIYKQKESEM